MYLCGWIGSGLWAFKATLSIMSVILHGRTLINITIGFPGCTSQLYFYKGLHKGRGDHESTCYSCTSPSTKMVFLHHRQQRGWLVFKYRYPWKRKLQFGWNKLMNDKYLIAFIYKKKHKKTAQKLSFTITSNCWYFVTIQFILGTYHKLMKVLSWSWSYGNSICNFLCNQFLLIFFYQCVT